MGQSDVVESLGERVVKAARLAVAMHLYQAVAADDGVEGMFDQQIRIGGAGPYLGKEAQRGESVRDDRLC